MTVARSDFGDDFVWGTATASYQVEGAAFEDGRTASIWDTFARVPGAIVDDTNGDVADDHYHRFAEDVALMAELGVTGYRFSISWTRVLQPDGKINQPGIDFYRRLVGALRDHGITPYATLYHWDLPQPLEDAGGWLERGTADAFVTYTEAVVGALGDLVQNWITLNEPWCSAFLGYASGDHAPGRKLGSQSSHAVHHLLLAHGRAVPAIRRIQPDARVGIALNLYSVRPASDSPQDLDAARRIDGLSNRLFLEPVLQGGYPDDVIADLGEQDWFVGQPSEDLATINAPIDFLGINYYSRHTTAAGTWDGGPSANPGSEFVHSVDTGAPKTQMGWPIHPDGLVDVLRQANSYAPQLPLMITENGAAYPDELGPDGVDDPDRRAYIEQHVSACADAVREGIPLTGYFVWSLIDNFEWSFGLSRRFGLVHVDYSTQQRTIKNSGRWYQAFLSGQPQG
jgi:beta-glucosidase